MNHVLIPALAAFLVFCAALLAISIYVNRKKRAVMAMRIGVDGSLQAVDAAEQSPLLGLNEPLSPRAAAVSGLLQSLGVDVEAESLKLDHRLAQAGVTSSDAPVWFIFCQRVLVIPCVGLGLWGLLGVSSASSSFLIQCAGVGSILVGLFGPKLWLQNQIDRRRKLLIRSFPDTLDLLMVCVESGLALDAALNRVCAELGRAYPEIAGELNRTRIELAMLNDRIRALMNLGDRVNIVAFRSLVAALVQSERFGTSLVDTMRVLSEDYRLSRLMDAETKAARLPVLLTIPLMLLLMPAFFIIILGPTIVNFVHNGAMLTGQ